MEKLLTGKGAAQARRVLQKLVTAAQSLVLSEIGTTMPLPLHRILVLFGKAGDATPLHRDCAPAKNLCLSGKSLWIVMPMTAIHQAIIKSVVSSLPGEWINGR